MRIVQRFFHLKRTERRLLLEAIWQLLRCRVLFILLPYSKLEKKFAQAADCTLIDSTKAHMIRTAILRASRLSLWQNKCLVQTFTARALLNRRKMVSVAFLGVQIDGSTPDFAHAWIVSGDVEVIPSHAGYVMAHEF